MRELEILFCRTNRPLGLNDPLQLEGDALDELGINGHFIDIELVASDQLEEALEPLPEGDGTPLLYRGWILKEEEYEPLHEALLDRGYAPVTSPSEYAEALYLPNYFPKIADLTAPARWTWGTDLDEAWETARSLGPGPYFLKDHVKSAKEHWRHCSWIPENCDRETFDRTCQNFIDYQDDRFERGLVFRPILPIRRLPGESPGYPLHDEHRLFFFHGELLVAGPYHDADTQLPDYERFAHLGSRIDAPFFTADVAQLQSGEWTLIELNDGGASGIPPLIDPRDLYRALSLASTQAMI